MSAVNKRKYSPLQESNENDKPRGLDFSALPISIERDHFCWICHKVNTNWHCSTCIRTFHNRCTPLPLNTSQCLECIASQQKVKKMKMGESLSDIRELNRLLTLVYHDILNGDWLETVQKIDSDDWALIGTKLRDEKYYTTLEFINDLKWTKHRFLSKNNDESTDFMDDLLDRCCMEMKLMEMCSECYSNSHKNPTNYFVNACKSKHKPVWARVHGFPYWPAKVMEVKKVENLTISYNVQFFGKHDIGEAVPFDEIKEYWIKNPNNDLNAKDRKDLDDCMREWNEYIKNYKAAFESALANSPISIDLTESESALEDSPHSIDLEVVSSSETDRIKSFISCIKKLREENKQLKIDLKSTRVERNDSQDRVQLLEAHLRAMSSTMNELRTLKNHLSSKVEDYSELFKGFERLMTSFRGKK